MQHIPSAGTPKLPFPWHLPGDRHSLHLPPAPGTVPPAPSHATFRLAKPEHEAQSFALSSRYCQAPRLGKPPPARHSSRRRLDAAKEEPVGRLRKPERSYL